MTSNDGFCTAMFDFEEVLPGWWYAVWYENHAGCAQCGPIPGHPGISVQLNDPGGDLESALRALMKKASEVKEPMEMACDLLRR